MSDDVFDQLFRWAGGRKAGIIETHKFEHFMKKTQLPEDQLQEIFDTINEEDEDELSKAQFFEAMKLAAAQQPGKDTGIPVVSGYEITPEGKVVNSAFVSGPEQGLRGSPIPSVGRSLSMPTDDVNNVKTPVPPLPTAPRNREQRSTAPGGLRRTQSTGSNSDLFGELNPITKSQASLVNNGRHSPPEALATALQRSGSQTAREPREHRRRSSDMRSTAGPSLPPRPNKNRLSVQRSDASSKSDGSVGMSMKHRVLSLVHEIKALESVNETLLLQLQEVKKKRMINEGDLQRLRAGSS
eukprot:Clim_evm94s172 gene=Clim_evmTU94s172